MTVLQSEVQFGGNKVIVYFSAPGRVDFRELVKELASGLKARVELKQVGARDEAKLVGGVGICGREFCCSSFLREFVPVSIKMAKNQNLALNPSKVSGGCGRLLCCLTYENDLYSELRRKLPPRGTRVRCLEDGVIGDVIKGDVLNQIVVIETSEGRQQTVPVAQLEILGREHVAAEDSEADAWGEDIDLAALDDLSDEPARPAARGPRGGGRGGEGGGRGGEGRGGENRGGEGGGRGGEGRGGKIAAAKVAAAKVAAAKVAAAKVGGGEGRGGENRGGEHEGHGSDGGGDNVGNVRAPGDAEPGSSGNSRPSGSGNRSRGPGGGGGRRPGGDGRKPRGPR